MKKMIAWILSLILALTATAAFAEEEENLFETLAGMEWEFASGVGGWSTDLRILPDGSFSGEYHDSEMGDSAEEYPDGTVYLCSFTGQMSVKEQAEDGAWIIRVDRLKTDESQEAEYIDGGIRYLAAEPYGLSEGDEMRLYRPGTPVNVFSEDMLFWAHVLDQVDPPYELENWFLCSEKNSSGFVGYPAEPMTGLANPWEDLTAEQMEASGFSFGLPEGAENVIYRYLPGQGLAEMQFTWEGSDFCARMQSAGEWTDISGMYFDWEDVQEVTVGYSKGTIGRAQTGSEDWVALCLWFDEAPGIMYSLSVSTTDPDSLDLAAIAEAVYIPTQGETDG